MILAFKPQFVQPILAGVKIHSLREDLHDRWKVGSSIQMATGVRTKLYNCFKEDECRGIQRVMVCPETRHTYIVRGNGFLPLDAGLILIDTAILSRNDGFESIEAFWDYFKDSKVYKIVHWTDFRY